MELLDTQPLLYSAAKMDVDRVHIYPVSDVQDGVSACDIPRFKEYIEQGVNDPYGWFLGIGDYADVASPSGRRKIQNADFYDSVHDALESKADEEIDRLANLMHRTEGRWLGMHEGHHYYQYRDGTTTDTKLAEILDAPFLGTCSILNIPLNWRSGSSLAIQVFSHHGQGGGRSIAAPLNKIWPLVPHFPTVDIFFIAHFHKKIHYKFPALPVVFSLNRGILTEREKLVACTGGYLRGYDASSRVGSMIRGNYVEQALMTPNALGGIVVKLQVKREQRGRRDVAKLLMTVED